ncbi:MAG: hypothetical protein EXR98_14905 [Gemmataceae bacterium]|nr:hypothetical protein [Gemmataceae bacterium]
MTSPSQQPAYVLPSWLQGWEQFWFKPADPSVLGLVRISCGLVVLYVLAAYSFKLQDLMGEHAWHDLENRLQFVRDRPILSSPLDGGNSGWAPQPSNEAEQTYLNDYLDAWGERPPAPYPTSQAEAVYLNQFRFNFGMDLRINGIKPSVAMADKEYAARYTLKWKTPPKAYVLNEEEEEAVDTYISRHNQDPHGLYAKGAPIFSLWFHVLDSQAMAIVHGVILLVALLFTLGFCTRITSALLWFGSLSYIHRCQSILFGMDTMTNIVLLYLAISPCGSAYSVDRLIRKWWVRAKPGIVLAWYRFWKLPTPSALAPARPVPETPEPSVAANVAIRLLQIHVCIIYGMAGLSKLQGVSWWNGTALWMTVASYEFAPMQFGTYVKFLTFLGNYPILQEVFLTGGGLFTLTFEIGYLFLIWRPKLRWVFLAGAIILHAGIGLFMGLKTFSLIMLVMNMIFLRPEEVAWIMEKFADPMSLWRRSG